MSDSSTERPGDPRPPIESGRPGRVPPPPPGYPPMVMAAEPRRPGIFSRAFSGLLGSVVVMSLLLNVYFFIIVGASIKGPVETVYAAGDVKHRIVILPIQGMIGDDMAAFVHEALQGLRANPPKALVLRIDSGGGGVSASDRIWNEINTFKADTGVPVIASFGSVAASGGYYVAAPADRIVAEPTSITGSIGVIAQAFTVEELLNKIGVKPEVIVSTDSTAKDTLSPFRSWNEHDREELRELLDDAYDRFVKVIGQGRTNLDESQIKAIATGAVFTCRRARELGLVDDEGYLADALDTAGELSGIGDGVTPHVTVLSSKPGLSELLGVNSIVGPGRAWSADELRSLLWDVGTPRISYRWTMP